MGFGSGASGKEKTRRDTATVTTTCNEVVARLAKIKVPLRAEPIREVRREFSKRVADWAPDDVVGLALCLLSLAGWPNRLVAYELLTHNPRAMSVLNSATVQRLGKGIDNWGAVDTFSLYVSGPAWREGQIPDRLINQWVRSSDRWLRRAALVSTVALNCKARGERGDTERTLSVCEKLLGDRDDMVVKALSWALRELSKRDPEVVRTFLQQHESEMASRIIREVGNKLRSGVKNPRH
ncbi:MAG TPA: DNA alkylation repair protein [Blastocatellia bacterium]|nr:DNA alkylation repair protein [Blastocatellia bacterium]